MARSGRRSSGGDDPQQLKIDWTSGMPTSHTATVPPAAPSAGADSSDRTALPLVQLLPWDFKTSFPMPTDEAIDSGVIDETDRQPKNLKSLHKNYAQQCLATLAAIDKVMDARRKGIDPGTGNKPRTYASRERLRKYLAEEPGRLEHSFDVLIETYADAFGQEATDAFRKAIRAWHAGIDVAVEQRDDSMEENRTVQRIRRVRASSSLPVPKPLRSSEATGIFGNDEKGKPVRPNDQEVRAITEQHADRMIEMTDEELRTAVTRYAEDFGSKAAAQLERYVRRKQHSR